MQLKEFNQKLKNYFDEEKENTEGIQIILTEDLERVIWSNYQLNTKWLLINDELLGKIWVDFNIEFYEKSNSFIIDSFKVLRGEKLREVHYVSYPFDKNTFKFEALKEEFLNVAIEVLTMYDVNEVIK